MRSDFPLFPQAASELARQVDAIYLVWAAISIFFSLLIAGLILYFMTRYHRRSPDAVGKDTRGPIALEIVWSVIPLLINLAMFFWGAQVFFRLYHPPEDAVEYFAVGKQWMWKFQHPEGVREINELHVPAGQAIKMTMTSEDVIHSFYVPALRTKQDVLPDRYTTTWFKADRPGTYHLFCAEYCGAEHSKMIGSVIVMEPTAYEAWLAGGKPGQTTVASGAQLFSSLACETCHRPGTAAMPARAPKLDGLFGHQQQMRDGEVVTADETYLRESILKPQAKVVAGWDPIMPTFEGQVTEEQLVQLIAYIKSLTTGDQATATGGDQPAAGAAPTAGTGAGPAVAPTADGAGEPPTALKAGATARPTPRKTAGAEVH